MKRICESGQLTGKPCGNVATMALPFTLPEAPCPKWFGYVAPTLVIHTCEKCKATVRYYMGEEDES